MGNGHEGLLDCSDPVKQTGEKMAVYMAGHCEHRRLLKRPEFMTWGDCVRGVRGDERKGEEPGYPGPTLLWM